MNLLRTRWINICSVYQVQWPVPLYMANTSCTRAVCHVNWRGRQNRFVWQFASWREFRSAVVRRLEMAGLEPALRLPVFETDSDYQKVWVLVRRIGLSKMESTTLTLTFLSETDLARWYAHGQTQIRQWVPKSVTTMITEGQIAHVVKIENWWLKQNPFIKKAAPQDELF